MNLDQFVATWNGQSPLYNTRDASLRGQCVQLVCFYVTQVWGKPVIWADAAQWWYSGALSDQYDRIANNHGDPNQVPPRGAIVIFDRNLPGSGGAGHIDICLDASPGSNTWTGFDSNWGGKYAHTVIHNYQYVLGWLLPKDQAPTPEGGDEMIANETQAHQAYQLLRPNGDGSPDEIAATAGRRSWAGFASDAQPEVAARNANLKAQADQLGAMQNTINQLNQTVTNLQNLQAQGNVDEQRKDEEIKSLQDQMAQLTTQLETQHDQLKDQINTPIPAHTPTATDPKPQPNLLTKLILGFLLLGKKKQ